MGKTTGFLSQVSGKLDDNFQTRQTSHGTFLARNPRKTSKPRRSEKQANTRCQLPNATANYRLYNGKLSEAYEGKSAGVSDFNSFVQVNYGKCAVYITKQVSASGGCVLGEYQFSRGSLPAISIGLNQSGILVSGIALGSLEIDANTTVADFSMAVLQNNAEDAVGLINLENRSAITELSVRLDRTGAVRRLEDIATARRRLNGNGNPVLVFEALFCALIP